MQKPRLSFWQIWNMSFGFLGIQFGFGLQNANTSRIFETLGANVEDIPILWIAAPVTGLLIQPIIGHMSDKTWGRLGRRRPYFLVGAILASLALIVMPNSPYLWFAAGMLWIMDASINISMEPFRAFVGDMLPSSQSTEGFAMQSFFIGTGAVVASALPWMFTNWVGLENTAPEGMVAPSVKWAFYVGGAVFFLAVLWTILRTKEYPPEELEAYNKADQERKLAEGKQLVAYDPTPFPASKFFKSSIIWLIAGLALTTLLIWVPLVEMENEASGVTEMVSLGKKYKELYIFAVGIAVFGFIQLIVGWLTQEKKTENGLVEVVNDLFKMPKTMRQLAVVQFFSWFGLFAMWIYTTNAVAVHLYGTDDTTSQLYNDAGDWVGVNFASYSLVAALVAFLLPVLAKKTNRKFVHAVCLIAGGLGLASVYFLPNSDWLLLSMVGIGIAWASILSMPYAMLTNALPYQKMGVFMGIFNFFIVIPQITAAGVLGPLVDGLFGGQSIYALMLGGALMVLAALLVRRVDDIA
jgi:maltose/moltooligosaccharide transporter